MSQEDYYRILGVSPESSADDVKKSYRKLALETHPDRNPDDAGAEERFKKISEAYGVLSDPGKRSQYDQYRRLGIRSGPNGGPSSSGFGYSQEEIFRDFFKSRQAQDVFTEMAKEFQRMGMRFDDGFINRTFFGNKTIFFQWGPLFGNSRMNVHVNPAAGARPTMRPGEAQFGKTVVETKPKTLLQEGASLLANAGKRLGSYLLRKALKLDGPSQSGRATGGYRGSDVTYRLIITPIQAMGGATVEVELPHSPDGKHVSVNIPAGTRHGAKLRLKQMGLPILNNPNNRGDLYLQVQVQVR